MGFRPSHRSSTRVLSPGSTNRRQDASTLARPSRPEQPALLMCSRSAQPSWRTAAQFQRAKTQAQTALARHEGPARSPPPMRCWDPIAHLAAEIRNRAKGWTMWRGESARFGGHVMLLRSGKSGRSWPENIVHFHCSLMRVVIYLYGRIRYS